MARLVPLVAAAFVSLLLALAARAGLAVPLGSVASVPLRWLAPVAVPAMFWYAWRRGDPAHGAQRLAALHLGYGPAGILSRRQ